MNQRIAHFELLWTDCEHTLKTTVFSEVACLSLERDQTNKTGIKLNCLSAKRFGLPQCEWWCKFCPFWKTNIEIFPLTMNQQVSLHRHKKLTSHCNMYVVGLDKK